MFVCGVILRIARAIFWVPPPQKINKDRFAWVMGSDIDFRRIRSYLGRDRRPRLSVTGDNHSFVGRWLAAAVPVRKCYFRANVSRTVEDVAPYRL